MTTRSQRSETESYRPFLCECDDPRCESSLLLTPTAYRSLRSLALAPGHQVLGLPARGAS